MLLISVDTLRADHLSSHGYARRTSPFLDGLARNGVRFERAYAPSSWTVPSMVSMVTGVYPSRHRMGGRHGANAATISVIPEELPTLAALLRDNGYRTYGLTANLNLPAKAGFARGFDRFECLGSVDLDAVDLAIDPWLKHIEGDSAPWFLWLHLFDPHGPYRAREPWIDEFAPSWRSFAWLDGLAPPEFARQASTLDRAALDAAIAIYDSDIRATDEFVRSLFERLPAARDAFMVFTSDHGEAFLEHGRTLHGGDLYDEQIHVPLIVHFPGRRGAGVVVSGAASLVDVLPTFLGAAGITRPPRLAGLDLQGLEGWRVPADRVVWAELLRGPVQRASMDSRWKLITDSRKPMQDELFDLAADPGERRNVVREQAEPAMRLRAMAAEFTRDSTPIATPPAQIELTPEQIKKLEALGYVGGDPIGR